mgnify:CR=1 FL=1
MVSVSGVLRLYNLEDDYDSGVEASDKPSDWKIAAHMHSESSSTDVLSEPRDPMRGVGGTASIPLEGSSQARNSHQPVSHSLDQDLQESV